MVDFKKLNRNWKSKCSFALSLSSSSISHPRHLSLSFSLSPLSLYLSCLFIYNHSPLSLRPQSPIQFIPCWVINCLQTGDDSLRLVYEKQKNKKKIKRKIRQKQNHKKIVDNKVHYPTINHIPKFLFLTHALVRYNLFPKKKHTNSTQKMNYLQTVNDSLCIYLYLSFPFVLCTIYYSTLLLHSLGEP